ncbi:MAG: hypothetical protein PG981_001534 [Wolbachia endosymbiont of Ctenocephalides orientis wCori]|nr:MAG: hypothetical protein PG981_001534 [Wolbachia endosymbiont of Ctenocephalides orientis wCori]
MGRNEEQSACIADSQSVKTTEKGGSRLRRREENQRQKEAYNHR